MIIQEINATVNGNSLSGEVIVSSPVLTATKQSEDGNLTKSPNFKLKLTGVTPVMNIIDTVQVEFTNGDFNYTANMTVINVQQNGTVTLQYVDGLTVEEAAVPSFTWDGADENSPIQVDVELNEFNAIDIRINPNLSAPEDMQYMWDDAYTWTPDIEPGWYSNTNDFPIVGQLSDVFVPQTDVDSNNKQFWINGPTTAGTYLKSYTLTFVYNKEFSDVWDEKYEEQFDDPVAQALDGTSITFWVQYNVTDARTVE